MKSSSCNSWMGKKLPMTLAAFALSGVLAFAQTKSVSGTIVDEFGEPIIGANVLVQGTTNGAVTDLDGNFTISGVSSADQLVVTYIGYAQQTLTVGGQSTFNITLKEDGTDLEEVVVVGYGVMKKKDLTGSVASIKTGDLQNVAAANPMQAMQAKVPGVDLSTSDGQAGSGVKIQLRGNRSILASNSPLILVDGVEYGSTLDIPASDIESMDILKDAASTAIYGTKGANGVIIITTKRGSKDSKTKVNVNAYLSVNTPTGVVKPMFGDKEVQRLVDAKDYQDAAANNWTFAHNNTVEGVIGNADRNGISLLNDVIANGSYADWQDIILQTGTTQNYEVSVSGGGKKTNFNASASLMNDAGMLKYDTFRRYTVRTNIDHEINSQVKMGTSISFAFRDNDKRNSSVYNQTLKMTSITHAYLPDGSIHAKPSYFYDAHCNPLLDEVEGAFQHNIQGTRFFGSAYLQWTPIQNLVIKTNFTVDRNNQRDGLYQDYESIGRYQSPHTSSISNETSTSTKYVWQNTANYNLNIAKNSMTFLLGHEQTNSIKEVSAISGDCGEEHYYNSSFYDVSKIGAPSVTSSYVQSQMQSFFGRVNYSYDSKYLLQASLRADGSSVLADGHKWGIFPSASLGWRMIDESFMESTRDFMDNLKLRASWGLSGNAAIDAYQTLATVNAIVPNANDKAPMTMANPELTWEKTSALDFGLDLSFFNGRLSAVIDYYLTNTYDLLYYKTAPASQVFTSTLANIGKTKGHGLEIQVDAVPVRTKDFEWSLGLSGTFASDQVDALRDGIDQVVDGTSILKVGEPVSAFYNYEMDGCWGIGEFTESTLKEKPYAHYGEPGTPKVIDQNGDGKIDDEDKIIYSRTPSAILGLTNNLSWKNFSLSVQMMARLGGYMSYGGYGNYTYDNSNWTDLVYWTPENQSAMIPSPGADATVARAYASAYQTVGADYFKIKDITLSYNFSKNLLQKAAISNARVYCSLKNFFTVSKVDDYDAERGGSLTFPLAKQIVVGVNVSF